MDDQDYDLLMAVTYTIGDPDLYVEDLGHCNYSIVSRADVAAAKDQKYVGITNFDGLMYADTIDGAHPTTGPSVDSPLAEIAAWAVKARTDILLVRG